MDTPETPERKLLRRALDAYDTQNPGWQPAKWFEQVRQVLAPPPPAVAEPALGGLANDRDPESLEQADV